MCMDMFLYIFHPSILFCKNKNTQDEREWGPQLKRSDIGVRMGSPIKRSDIEVRLTDRKL